MRARRTGDPSIKLKPGPKPKPGGKVNALSALERELARLRAENAALRRRSQQGPKSKDEIKPAGSRTERLNHPRDELGIANAKIASMRGEIRELQAKLKVKVEMPKDVVALQQQLMAAKTELRNLKVEMKAIRRTLDEARRANPVTITKANLRKLQKVFHPDPEHNTATSARKAQLNAAAAIFNAIKFRVLDRD